MNRCFKCFTTKSWLLLVVWGSMLELSFSTHATELEDSIDTLLGRYDRQDAPGVAVGVVKEGEILYAKGWGMADLEQGVSLTPDSVFDIASVSKQFAGVAIAMLEDQDKVQTTDLLRDHVTGLPEVFAPVQLHHLLHHTSGIRDWPGAFVLGGRRFDDVITFRDILSLARRQEALSFEPGEMYSYSNTGYNLLARTVETVTGQGFSEWMHTQVFQPLEMDSTYFYDDHNALVQQRARSYSGTFDGPFKNVGDQLTAFGSSSLYSSVNDLLKWIVHFDQPKITSSSVIKKSMTPGKLNNGASAGYAYGFGVGHVRGALRISHSGGWAGFRTFLLYFPEFQLGVVVLCNWSGANSSDLAHRIAEKVIGDDWPPNQERPKMDDSNSIRSIQSDTWNAWTGDYFMNNNPSSKLMFFGRNQNPWIRLPSGKGFALKASSSNSFFNQKHHIKLWFSAGVNDWPRSVIVESHEWNGAAKEHADDAFESDEGESYEGEYYSNELLARYSVRFEDGELIARHHRHEPVRLIRFAKDRFTSNTWYWKQVDFDRDFQGEVSALRVTQGRNRNIMFRKVR